MQETVFTDTESLPLSGLQHYAYCPRQWALLHIEQQWCDNYLTASGTLFHERAHDSKCNELRGDVLTVRALQVSSRRLRLHGVCDVVEYHRSSAGVRIAHYEGLWCPYPVEYKRGKKKLDDCDRLQVCAQAMCLEEMHQCTIDRGALYYGAEAHREVVSFDGELRQLVVDTCEVMHEAFARGDTFAAHWKQGCKSCSLVDICLPRLPKSKQVLQYLCADLEVE